MADETLAIIILWAFIFIYAVAASIDFGAGFWSMVYLNRKQMNATSIANRYLSPSWEVTNVFIVLIVVSIYSFFPGANYILGSTLLLPGSFILLLLALRSAFLVFSHSVKRYRETLTIVSGICGFLIPALLILVLPVTHGTFISDENNVKTLDFSQLIGSLSFYAFVGFAITNTLYLSSLLLADYSRVANDRKAYQIYRRDALILGPTTFVMAFFIIFSLRYEAQWLYTNLLDYKLWLFISAAALLIGYFSLLIKRPKFDQLGWPRVAMISTVLQYLFASYAYGRAHFPYIVYPYITISEGFTDHTTFRALAISYLIGFIILVPGFILFWRLFLNDKRYLRTDGPEKEH